MTPSCVAARDETQGGSETFADRSRVGKDLLGALFLRCCRELVTFERLFEPDGRQHSISCCSPECRSEPPAQDGAAKRAS